MNDLRDRDDRRIIRPLVEAIAGTKASTRLVNAASRDLAVSTRRVAVEVGKERLRKRMMAERGRGREGLISAWVSCKLGLDNRR
jgi:hypothetical protein